MTSIINNNFLMFLKIIIIQMFEYVYNMLSPTRLILNSVIHICLY